MNKDFILIKNKITMKKTEKKLTVSVSEVENSLITGAKELFLLLSAVVIERRISVAEISAKIGIAKTAYYRYQSDYPSQNPNVPSLQVLLRFANALGYEFRVVNKKIESNSDEQKTLNNN